MTASPPRPYPFAFELLDVSAEYTDLREGPLRRVQLPYGEPAWLATRYADVKAVLADPTFSRAAAVGRDEPRTRPHPTGPDTIMSYDPPEHSRLRRLVTQAFTVRRVETLRGRTQQIADGLVEAMIAKGSPADLVADFGLPLPTLVICELLGVPADDRERFGIWSDAFLSTTKYTPEQVRDHVGALSAYMAGLIDARRSDPRTDLLSALVAARDNDDRLSESELLVMAQSLLIAGHETTASQIPNFIYTLLAHPDQLAILRSEPELVPQAVEELLRFTPLGAGGGQPRYALEDVEIGGVTVRAGEPVLVALHSANRDEAVFTDPDVFDLSRQGASHVAFGHGVHHCIGAPLARMELQVAVRTLLARLSGLRLTGEEDVEWKTGLSTRGPARMPVTWDRP
ncbi:cytochrome P450 [Glycomyces sp. NPDC047369]